MSAADPPELQLKNADLMGASLRRSLAELERGGPLTEQTIENADERLADRIDAFALRFGRLQDTMGARLFRLICELDLETPPSAMIDILTEMEKRDIVAGPEVWLDIRGARNALAHEYFSDPTLVAAHLNAALVHARALLEIYDRTRAYILRRRPDLA